ncbi:MAG: DUF1080 domain-containing protein [Verrucomicrobiota bacterium]
MIWIPKPRITLTTFRVFLLMLASTSLASAAPESLLGDWALNLDSGEPAWLSVYDEGGETKARMRVYVGPEGPYETEVLGEEAIRFTMKPKRLAKGSKVMVDQVVEVGIKEVGLAGVLVRTPRDESGEERINFTGKRIPPMPESPPDLSKVRFGHPISLFNGKDLTGWRPYENDKINGWSVEGGLLVNSTPKTDFSATGDHANLRTEAEFDDFWLHIEFLIEADRNSGVYLRGTYEAQVVDRDSRMQGLQGVGAIFSRIEPSVNAGRPPGEWQTYDITLVDRHVTVVLNGVKVIDNEPVIGPTGGAINTDPMAPGPIYPQGDHTAVKYRDIYLAPVIRERD